MFGKNTNEPIPHPLLTTYKAWDDYLATIWASLIYYAKVPKEGILVEVAPGASPKIAYALEKIHFCGEVYLVEPYYEALKLITKKYQDILPQATIYPLQCSLQDSLTFLPQTPDCVISHHPLDDMLMAMEGGPEIFEQLFAWINQDKLEIHSEFAARWQDLLCSPTTLNRIEKEVVQQWISFVSTIKPNLLLMSQYPSLVLETAATKGLNQRAQALLQQLKHYFQAQLMDELPIQDLLNLNIHYNVDLISNEVLNAKNWLMYQKGQLK